MSERSTPSAFFAWSVRSSQRSWQVPAGPGWGRGPGCGRISSPPCRPSPSVRGSARPSISSAARPAPDFLAVATPGAGKTTFALACASGDPRRLGRPTVPPSAAGSWSSRRRATSRSSGRSPRTGSDSSSTPTGRRARASPATCTASSPRTSRSPPDKAANALRGLSADGMVILDEIHHAGHERAWGDGVFQAFELAAKRLSLSGTPFRSDSAKIPFVRYDVIAEGDLAHADYTYGYADALRDGGVVRPVYFPRVDGQMEWSTPSGDVLRATFGDELARDQGSARLRTALSLDGDWLPTVLGQAHERLRVGAPAAARCRWPRDRHRPGSRAGNRPPVAQPVRRRRRRGRQRRPWRVEEDRRVRGRATGPGSWRCGWCRRASTSRACGSASTPPPRRPSCSSARPSAASCAGRQAAPARRRSSTSPTTRDCASTRSRSPRRDATCCARPANATTSSRPTASSTRSSAPTTCSSSCRCSASCRRPPPASACTASPRTACSSSTTNPIRPTRCSPPTRRWRSSCPRCPTEAGSVAWSSLSVAEQKDDLRTRNADVAKRLVDLTGWGHARVQGEMNRLAGVRSVDHRHDRPARTPAALQRELAPPPPRRLTRPSDRCNRSGPASVWSVVAMSRQTGAHDADDHPDGGATPVPGGHATVRHRQDRPAGGRDRPARRVLVARVRGAAGRWS